MSVQYGLLIDYDYCTGCHSCEVACRKALDLGSGQFGIKILQDGPRELPDGKWEFNFLPMPTSLCDLCAERTGEGKPPACACTARPTACTSARSRSSPSSPPRRRTARCSRRKTRGRERFSLPWI